MSSGEQTGIVSVYVTFPSGFAADDVLRGVVSDKLAACANLIPGVISFYRWDERIERDPEIVAILKTTADRAEALVARLRESHPYETPCIVTWPVSGGFAPYLDWVREETQS